MKYFAQSTRLRIHWLYPLQNSKIYQPPPKKKKFTGMTLNCIWWWDSSSEDLVSMEFAFITIIPRSTLTQSGSISLGPIYGSNRSV